MTDSNGSVTKISIKGLGEFSNREDLLIKLLKIAGPVHDSDHAFEDDPAHPGRCLHCQWLNTENEQQLKCGHTLREHLDLLIQHLMLGGFADADETKFKLLLLKLADMLGLELDLPEQEIGVLRAILNLIDINVDLDRMIAEAMLGSMLSMEIIIIEERKRRGWPFGR